MKKKKFSIHLVGQERKHHGEIGMEHWNGQGLGPRRGGLEPLIQGECQDPWNNPGSSSESIR